MARKRRKHNSESPPSKKSRPFQADLNADFIPLQNESEILQDKKKKAETETMQYIKKMAPALNKDGEEAIIAARAVLGGLGKLTIEMCFHEPANRVMIVAIKVADYSTVCDFLDAIFNGIYDLSELKGGCLIIETALKRLVDVLPQFEDHHRIQMWMDSFIEVVNSNPGDFLGGASFKARLITAFAECATGSILTAKPIEAANRPGFLVSLTEKLARSLAEVGSLFVLISDCDSASLAIQSLLWALQSMQLNDAFDAVVTPLIKPSEDCDVTRIVNMCTSSISSHVLERILTSPSWYEVIWKLIRNQLEEICVSSNGSFVIQRFLTFADSTSKVRKILKRLSPLMEAILDKGKHGIIVKIAEVGLIHVEIDDDLWKFIRDALHINEDTSAEDSIGALCSLNPLKNKTHGITVVTYHGSVLIQTLLKCTKVVFEIMDSLFKVPPKKLIFIMSDKFGCYIFESVFASRVITVKNKLHLTELLKNNYLDLACSQHGSFVFEKIWSFLKMEKRISVASELAGDVDRLCDAPLLDTEEAAIPEIPDELETDRSTASRKSKQSTAFSEKLRKRREKAQENALQESLKTQRLRTFRGERINTRFETEMDIEKLKQQEIKLKERSKWREVMKETKKKVDLPSEQECYDFFTKTFDPEPEAKDPSAEKQYTTNDFCTLSEVVVCAADRMPLSEKLDIEKEMHFTPSMTTPNEAQRLPEGKQPRFPEDEGIFVGNRPPVSMRNLNRMEQRVLREGRRVDQWFGEDGRLIVLPNPVSASIKKPIILTDEELNPLLQTEFVKAFKGSADSRYIDGLGTHVGQYQLNVDLISLQFNHHPLFSKEHMLASRLEEVYDQYVIAFKRNADENLTNKLASLRVAVLHTEENIANCDKKHETHLLQLKARCLDYRHEMREIREQRDKERADIREFIKTIIKFWKLIKKVRQQTQCTNTDVKIVVKKQNVDYDADMIEWKNNLENELEEKKCLFKIDYDQLLAQYKHDMEAYNRRHKLIALEKRKAKRKKKRTQEDDEEDYESDSDEDEEELEELPKPEEPLPFDDQAVALEIEEKAMKMFRKPGEPILIPKLSHSVEITSTSQCPSSERDRRNAVPKSQYFIKIFFNDKEVSRTSSVALDGSNFQVGFNQFLNIAILQKPENLKLEVYQTGTFSSFKLAEVFPDIPDPVVNSLNVLPDSRDFASEYSTSFNHAGVGSGSEIVLDDSTNEKVIPMISGILKCSIAWAVSNDGVTMSPPQQREAETAASAMKKADPILAIGSFGNLDVNQLVEYIKNNNLDPNDPENADLMYFYKTYSSSDDKSESLRYYRLEPLKDSYDFCTDEDLNNNLRFRLLKARWDEIPQFKNEKMVCCLEKDIDPDIFKEYDKSLEEENKIYTEQGEGDAVDVEWKRKLQVRKKAYNRVQKQFSEGKHDYQFSGVVREDDAPDTANLWSTIKHSLEAKRPLRPERVDRKPTPAQNLTIDDVKILVTIKRAENLPRRKSYEKGETLAPFVEVTFKDQRVCTSTAFGHNASWNETVQLPFTTDNNDYHASSIQKIDDFVFINVFDEVSVDLIKDKRQRSEIHRKLERRWLGSIKIPFGNIYHSEKVDGRFRLNTPILLLGYEMNQTDSEAETILSNASITLFVTIEPTLSTPDVPAVKFKSEEQEELIQRCTVWKNKIVRKLHCDFSMMVLDINGYNVFVSRYIHPIPPPPSLQQSIGSFSAMERVAQFVANIPFVSDYVEFAGVCDIWANCEEFLAMCAGDEEEHAVLLTNFFLSMGKNAYLVQGTARPEGDTAYVLVQEGTTIEYWNPSKGERYALRDPLIPLYQVSALVHARGILVNVQQDSLPAALNYNFDDEKYWREFTIPENIVTIQPSALRYFDNTNTEKIQQMIDSKIHKKITEWRMQFRAATRWNRHCNILFQKVLKEFEYSKGTKAELEEHLQQLDSILKSHKVCGFPLKLPLTTIDAILNEIKSTGVHNATDDAEFARAVHLQPFTNGVYCVWIYIASLLKTR